MSTNTHAKAVIRLYAASPLCSDSAITQISVIFGSTEWNGAATTMRNRRCADDGKCAILVGRCRADDSKWGTCMRQCHDRVFISAVATDRRDSVVYVAPSSKVWKYTYLRLEVR